MMKRLNLIAGYLAVAVWDEPAIQKDKYSEPMELPESLGGPPEVTSKDDKSDKFPRRPRPDRQRKRKEDCPRKAFPFNNEDKEIREEGKVTENLPMAIEKLYVVEQEEKKKH